LLEIVISLVAAVVRINFYPTWDPDINLTPEKRYSSSLESGSKAEMEGGNFFPNPNSCPNQSALSS
jgi:hypothetical protein